MSTNGEIRPGCSWVDGTATWRVWAPNAAAMSVRLVDETDNGDDGSRTSELDGVEGGWWQMASTCAFGTEYLFVVDIGNGVVEQTWQHSPERSTMPPTAWIISSTSV